MGPNRAGNGMGNHPIPKRNANLRTQLERIIRRAGLKPWPKPFQNCRSTRETELAETYPIHVVCAWIGNTVAVAAKHYLQVTDADFEKASGGGARSGARCSKRRRRIRRSQRPPILAKLPRTHKAPTDKG